MKTLKNLSLLLLLSVFTFSCSDDDDGDSSAFDGSQQAIEEFFSPELVDALEDLGFILNQGSNPPNIEGVYLASPFVLINSTVPGQTVPYTSLDMLITFENQDNSSLTIDYHYDQIIATGSGYGSFVTGNNNKFAVYLKTVITFENNSADSAVAISGTITDSGIENLQMAGLMLDNKGNPSGFFNENNTGQLFYDSDEFSPEQ